MMEMNVLYYSCKYNSIESALNDMKFSNIDSKYINIILSLNICSLEEILLLNKNDLITFGIPNYVVEDLFSIIKTFIEQTFQETNLPIDQMSTSNV